MDGFRFVVVADCTQAAAGVLFIRCSNPVIIGPRAFMYAIRMSKSTKPEMYRTRCPNERDLQNHRVNHLLDYKPKACVRILFCNIVNPSPPRARNLGTTTW